MKFVFVFVIFTFFADVSRAAQVAINLDGATFSWSPDSPLPILSNLTFRVDQTQHVVVKGEAGKIFRNFNIGFSI